MNIKERKDMINSHIDLVHFGGDKVKDQTMDVAQYWNMLRRPPIRAAYLPDWTICRLWDIMTSVRMMSKPELKFKTTNDLLRPYGFMPLGSGTNRRAFYHVEDIGSILKTASDTVGQKDNKDEFVFTQHMIKPFCPKIFDVDGDGACALNERGEAMSEYEYKFVWASEIFDLLFALLQRGYILEDVGSNFYKNFGIRMGFGPMIWDLPYVYKIDYRKLKCIKPNPYTGKICGGEIDYAYKKGMSEIVCTKCGARYSAKYLSQPMPAESINHIVTERGRVTMLMDIPTFKVAISENGKTTRMWDETQVAMQQNPRFTRRTLAVGEPMPTEVTQTGIDSNGIVLPEPPAITAPVDPVQTSQQAPVQQQVMPEVTKNKPLTFDDAINYILNDPHMFEQAYNLMAKAKGLPPMQHAQQPQSQVIPTPPPIAEVPVVHVPPVQPPKAKPVIGPSMHMEENQTTFKVTRKTVKGSNGKKSITITPEEYMSMQKDAEEKGKQTPPVKVITEPPVIRPGMPQNKVEMEHAKPINTIGGVQEGDHYYRNGKKYFAYPKIVKNNIMQWLNRMEKQLGAELATQLADKLEIEYVSRASYEIAKKTVAQPRRVQEDNGSIVIHKPSALNVQNSEVSSSVSHTDAVDMVIAPPTGGYQLQAKAEKWQYRGEAKPAVQQQEEKPVEMNQAGDTQVTLQDNKVYTVVKPMTTEELEAAEAAKAKKADSVMGFPGQALSDNIRFKAKVPELRKMVEESFNNFNLDTVDTERQISHMEKAIRDMIEEDVAAICGTDKGGLGVKVTRTFDHENADCFKLEVTNFNSPVFDTLLYPAAPSEVDSMLLQNNSTVANEIANSAFGLIDSLIGKMSLDEAIEHVINNSNGIVTGSNKTPAMIGNDPAVNLTLLHNQEIIGSKMYKVNNVAATPSSEEPPKKEAEEDTEPVDIKEEIYSYLLNQVDSFDASNLKTAEEVKNELRKYLINALTEKYGDQLSVPKKFNIVNEFLEEEVKIEGETANKQATPQEVKTGTVSASL